MVLNYMCFERVKEIAAERGYPTVKCEYAGAYSDERVRFKCTDGRQFIRRGGVLVLNSKFEVVGEERVKYFGAATLKTREYRFGVSVGPDDRVVEVVRKVGSNE